MSEIAEVAGNLFATRGYAETSMADVANAVDLSPKAVYYYYDSKRAILDAILERGFGYFEEAALAEERERWPELSMREAMVESSLAAIEAITSHADLLRLSFAETFRGNPLSRARHEMYMRNWVRHVEVLLVERADEHGIGPRDRALVAQATVEALFGLAVDSVLRDRPHAWSEKSADRRRFVDTLVGSLLSDSE